MVLALTWSGWSGLLASVGVVLALWARHTWRAAVRQELVDYLAHAAPEIAVTGVHAGSLVYLMGEGGGGEPRRIALDAFYQHLADETRPGPPKPKRRGSRCSPPMAITMRAHAGRESASAAARTDSLRRAS